MADTALQPRFTGTLTLELVTRRRTAMTRQVAMAQPGFQDHLPTRHYQLLRMTAWSTGPEVVAVRSTLVNQVHRAGAAVLASKRAIPSAFKMDENVGMWGWAGQGHLSLLEVFCLNKAEGGGEHYGKRLLQSASCDEVKRCGEQITANSNAARLPPEC